jgi:hypothetical protein
LGIVRRIIVNEVMLTKLLKELVMPLAGRDGGDSTAIGTPQKVPGSLVDLEHEPLGRRVHQHSIVASLLTEETAQKLFAATQRRRCDGSRSRERRGGHGAVRLHSIQKLYVAIQTSIGNRNLRSVC